MKVTTFLRGSSATSPDEAKRVHLAKEICSRGDEILKEAKSKDKLDGVDLWHEDDRVMFLLGQEGDRGWTKADFQNGIVVTHESINKSSYGSIYKESWEITGTEDETTFSLKTSMEAGRFGRDDDYINFRRGARRFAKESNKEHIFTVVRKKNDELKFPDLTLTTGKDSWLKVATRGVGELWKKVAKSLPRVKWE